MSKTQRFRSPRSRPSHQRRRRRSARRPHARGQGYVRHRREITGAGNPTWRATHQPATGTADAVTRLLAAGATVIGKTICRRILLQRQRHERALRHAGEPARVGGAFPAAHRAARRPRLTRGLRISRSAAIPAARCACPRRFKRHLWPTPPRTGASISPVPWRWRRPSIPWAGSPRAPGC